MAKVKLNITLDADTKERLLQCAFEQHKTASQLITDWTWSAKVKGEQVRGQQSLSIGGTK